MTHPNVGVLEGMFEAFNQGDLGAALAPLSEQVEWHFPGRSRFAGTHRGRDAVVAHLTSGGEIGGTAHLVPVAFVGNGDYAVAVFDVHSELKGATLDDRRAMVCRFETGRIAEVWIHPHDQYGIDEFWG